MKLSLPQPSLVMLVGATASGKSSFAARHFLPTEVVSADRCRGLVCDDENDQAATRAAFELLHAIVGIRLRQGRTTVVDATNLRSEDRKALKAIAKEHDSLTVALLFDTPKETCLARNAARTGALDSQVALRHFSLFNKAARDIENERHYRVYRLSSERQQQATVERVPLENDRRDLTGPFDIIGDLHGCAAELEKLLERLGYGPHGHPDGRIVIFLGDLTDRGPRNLDCYEIVATLVERGHALVVAGNHDAKLSRFLEGRRVNVGPGLEKTVVELETRDDAYKARLHRFLDSLVSHYVLDGGRLVVAHAGIKEAYQGRASSRVRNFCLYGDTTGETDELGLPVRQDWAKDYRGSALVVYGHTPVALAVWSNRTINIDTGCVFGGSLTALRYPELELVQVPAAKVYFEPVRPLTASAPAQTHARPEVRDVPG